MGFESQFNSYTKCPSCGKHRCTVIESRINSDNTRRRRKKCLDCSERHTVYEVSEEFYKTAITHKQLIDRFIQTLNLSSSSVTPDAIALTTCDDCVHMRSYGCGFDFPDAGGSFAEECSMFEQQRA